MTARKITAAMLFAGAATSFASGGVLPEGFNITCQVNDGSIWNATNNQGDFTVDPNSGAISGASATGSWSADWDSINFSSGVADGLSNSASLTTAWSFTNTTGSTQLFTVVFTSPIANAIVGQTTIFGSITGGLTANTANQAAHFAAPGGGSVYTAMVNGSAVGPTLMNDPFNVQTNPPTQTAPLGFESFEFEPGPVGAAGTISIQHSFTLSAGDSVTFNSAFQIIPAPASFAVFALLGLGARRRRTA